MNAAMTPGIGFARMAMRIGEFDDNGLMRMRFASINDLPIRETERKYYWAAGRRPDDHPGLSDLGLFKPNASCKCLKGQWTQDDL